MELTREKLEKILLLAIDILLNRDFYLLENDVNERTITFKLASYIEYLLGRGYDVDCEYNRNISEDSIKKIKAFNQRNESTKTCYSEEDCCKKSCVYPDIIVHRRGSNDNILIIEVKKKRNIKNNKELEYDKFKLREYTREGKNGLNYKYGVLINLGVKEKCGDNDIIWYQNGEEISY